MKGLYVVIWIILSYKSLHSFVPNVHPLKSLQKLHSNAKTEVRKHQAIILFPMTVCLCPSPNKRSFPQLLVLLYRPNEKRTAIAASYDGCPVSAEALRRLDLLPLQNVSST